MKHHEFARLGALIAILAALGCKTAETTQDVELLDLHAALEELQERDPRQGVVTRYYDFFPVTVRDNRLMSEDWMFCELCRDNDVPIYLNANVVCDHVGSHAFSVRQ